MIDYNRCINELCEHATKFRYGNIDQYGNYVPAMYHLDLNSDGIVSNGWGEGGAPLEERLLDCIRAYRKTPESEERKYLSANGIIQTPEMLEKSKTCECWDSTVYVAHKLNEVGIPHTEFFISLNLDPECRDMSHAFSICSLPDSGNYFLVEPAFKEIAGVYGPCRDLKTALSSTLNLYRPSMKEKLEKDGETVNKPIKYRVWTFNGLDPMLRCMPFWQFFPYIQNNGKLILEEF